jgi:hypothetical protein
MRVGFQGVLSHPEKSSSQDRARRMRATVGTALFCVIWLALQGAYGSALDGNDWIAMTQDEKVSWAIGFLSGVTVQNGVIKLMLWTDLPDRRTDEQNGILAEFANNIQADVEGHEAEYNRISPRQLADGVSQIYADYRNRLISSIDIIPVVMGSIFGSSKDWTEKLLVLLRKKANEH